MLIDGKQLAEKILTGLVSPANEQLQMAAVLVGDNPGLKAFVKLKKRAAESIGLNFASYEFSAQARQNFSGKNLGGQAPERDIIETIRYLNADQGVQGIFVELPMPEHFDRQNVLDAIVPAKDVDVLSSGMQELFYAGKSKILPPAVRALEMVFREYKIEPKGKKIAVFGAGFLVGKPIAHWLKNAGADVSVIDIDTPEPQKISRTADIIISGVGKPKLIKANMVREGAIVVDYGYPAQSFSADRNPPAGGKGRTLSGTSSSKGGDVDFTSVSKKASHITPVPGGMGPLVIAAVLENFLTLNSTIKN